MTLEAWMVSLLVCSPAIVVLILAVWISLSTRIRLPVTAPDSGLPFGHRARVIDQEEFDRGRQWAQSVIRMDGDGSVEMLEGFVEGERDYGRYSDFDRGVESAIAEHQTKGETECTTP